MWFDTVLTRIPGNVFSTFFSKDFFGIKPYFITFVKYLITVIMYYSQRAHKSRVGPLYNFRAGCLKDGFTIDKRLIIKLLLEHRTSLTLDSSPLGVHS